MLLKHTDLDCTIADLRFKAHARSLQDGPDAKYDAWKLSALADQWATELVHCQAFEKYMRGNQLDDMERKALSTATGPTGGYCVPPPVIRELLRLARTHSPIRQYATVRTLTKGTDYPLPKQKTRPQTAWKRDFDPHPITAEMTFDGELIPTHHLVSTIAMSHKLSEDPALPIEEWFIPLVLDAFLADEGTAFVAGDGVNKPEGLLTRPGIGTVNSGHATQLTADGITALFYDTPQAYRHNGVWLMNGTTIEAAKKLKTTDGAYVFREGIFGMAPDTIHGRPVMECPDMPDIAAGATPIIFGDLSRYYIVDREEMGVLRDPYSAKPKVIFDCTHRVGGQVVDPSAFRKQLIAA